MARTYTSQTILATLPIKADQLNIDDGAVLRQFNGGLDQNNLPIASITSAMLTPGLLSDSAAAVAAGAFYDRSLSTYLAASSYHRSYLPQPTPFTLITLDVGADLKTEAGWRSFWPLMAGDTTEGTVLEFQAREGMIVGALQMDIERRATAVEVTSGATTYAAIHQGDTIQVAVFLNDVMIADSAPFYPKRCTVSLPFSFPAPSGYCRIEAKFRLVTQPQVKASTVAGVTYSYPAPYHQYPPMKLYNAGIWARNAQR